MALAFPHAASALNEPDSETDAGERAVAADSPSEEPPIRPRVHPLAIYVLAAAVASASLLPIGRSGPLAIAVFGAAVSAVFLYAFDALNPRLVGLELIGLTLGGYLLLPGAPVYWMMGSALGGGAAAILARKSQEEDDQFFLPPLTIAVMTFALFTFGQKGGWAESLALVGRYVEGYREAFLATLRLPENAEVYRNFQSMEGWEGIESRIGVGAVSLMIGLWALVLWLFNRFARRRLGRIDPLTGSMLLFRVRPVYSFLLIAALVLEILSVWLGRGELRMASWPLFAVCAVAFLVAHVGVVLYFAALIRLRRGGRFTAGYSLLVMAALALTLYFGPMIGLADVWVDFRKTRTIRDRFG